MKKGITLITLIVMATVMVILATTITITGSSAMNNSKKMKFASELLFMQEIVDNYISENSGNLPVVGDEITNSNLPAGEYYKIDNSLFGLVDTTYGRNLKNDSDDIYVLSKDTNIVYYLKGLKIGNEIYYTLNDELKSIINYTDTNIESRDGIIFTPSETNYTNQEITVEVQVPVEYSGVSVFSQNAQITDFTTEEEYNVYNITKASNFEIVVNYTKDSKNLKQVYNVSNYDNEAPTITVTDTTTLSSNENTQTSITISTTDNLSGIAKILYEVNNVEKEYFETENKGKIVTNNNIVVDKYTKYVTFYVVDKAGNSTILLETLNPTTSVDDYVKYGLVLHYDAINNTGNGHSSNTTVWKDLSGNGNNGILTNFDNTTDSGWNDNYLLFDGVDDYTLLNNVLKGNENFTIEYIITQKRYYSWEYFWGIIANYFGMESGESKYRTFYYSYQKLSASSELMGELNVPVYNALTVNSEVLNAYKSGEKVISNKSIVKPLYTNGEKFAIGADIKAQYPAQMDCYTFRIYNRALTDDEIKHNYNIDKTRFGI